MIVFSVANGYSYLIQYRGEPMTATEAAKYLDKRGLLRVENGKLSVPIYTVDVRESFGRIDVLVRPHDGQGETWVSTERIAWES